MFINASDLLVLKLGCRHWSLNFFPPPFLLLLFFTLSLPHPNTKYSLSLLLEDSYIYLITLPLTDITLTQTLITLFLEYCKVVFFLATLGLCCCERAFSSCGLSTLRLQCVDFSCGGFSCGRTWALECTGFRSCGLVAWQHVEGSSTRDQTHVPCTGRWILNPWTTRDVCKTSNYSLSASPLCFLMFANA